MNATLDQKQSSLIHATDESFWRALNPDLHITPFPLADSASSCIEAPIVEQCTSQMMKEGYFHTPPILTREKAERLSRVVADLVQRKFAPVFAFVYDEFWQLFSGAYPVLRTLLGDGYQMTPTDIWLWHVHQGPSTAGWGPHRDMPEKSALRDDKTPRVINVWIPLTDATPLNSCMYVLPMDRDPNLPDKVMDYRGYTARSFHDIRALPAEAGSAIGWNTHIMHWGGRSSEWATRPRISVAIYFHSRDCQLNEIDHDPAREGFNGLRFDKTLEMPFKSRVRAIAGAIDMYNSSVRADWPEIAGDLFAFSKANMRP
jgi:hypothetical protein